MLDSSLLTGLFQNISVYNKREKKVVAERDRELHTGSVLKKEFYKMCCAEKITGKHNYVNTFYNFSSIS